jgi:hypothetical protein
MYTFLKEPIAWADIEWSGLDEEGFEQKNTIRAKIVFLPLSEMERMLLRELATIKLSVGITLTDEEMAMVAEPAERTVDFAKRVVRDWSQILGPDKKPFPFTAENLEMMVEHSPGFASGFRESYRAAWQGQGKVREKNSPSSPSDGRAAEASVTTLPA